MRRISSKQTVLVFFGFVLGLFSSRHIFGSLGIGCSQSYFIYPKINVENIDSGMRHGSEVPKKSKIYIGLIYFTTSDDEIGNIVCGTNQDLIFYFWFPTWNVMKCHLVIFWNMAGS